MQVSNGAMTAGELAYGGRLKALEATVDTLEATIRGQEQELNELRWKNNCLNKDIKNNEDKSEKLLEKIQLLKRRFTSAYSVLQVKLFCW
jgi:chromosome segregation ATPase